MNASLRFASLIMLFLTNACGYRLRIAKPPTTPLFIALPVNDKAVEPIGQLVYDIFINHFAQCGYTLVDLPGRGYTLKTVVQYCNAKQHFISQDVVLMNKLVEVKLICELYNFGNSLVAEKSFMLETIVSKAQLPLQQDAYTNYDLRAMLERHAHIIEQAFRPYLR